MATTPTYGWPIPNLSDLADGPDGFSDLALAIENTVKDKVLSTYTPSWNADGASQPSNPSLRQGRYRIDHGVVDFSVTLRFGGSTTGGIGALSIGLPAPAVGGANYNQWVPCWLNFAGFGYFAGLAQIGPGGSACYPMFPSANNLSSLDFWRSSNTGGAVGTGIPTRAGSYSVTSGSEINVHGRYFAA